MCLIGRMDSSKPIYSKVELFLICREVGRQEILNVGKELFRAVGLRVKVTHIRVKLIEANCVTQLLLHDLILHRFTSYVSLTHEKAKKRVAGDHAKIIEFCLFSAIWLEKVI